MRSELSQVKLQINKKIDVNKLIDIYMSDVNEGQNQLYVSVSTVPKKLRDAFGWLFTVYA